MEVRIGLRDTGRELAFESTQSPAEVEKTVSEAIATAATLLKLSDDKGRTFIVPVAALAYVEIGADQARRVGFIA
ncbi:MAG: DUF3107 domain-containing protein [Micrococcales bacterium]|nr:DUF3107 domain-containing protein [Micrococcales bacterium]NBR60442.1 DUF3107 domain-containing protein [Actinomycetota bacterium]NBR54769.1 DUF3107 domain-containing protein [Micrococcales bacterium]NBT46390.1 DUF3107 domain-containing protein [Actinomycetota bacterium]NBY44136.1 DUF3107 domain-containing protein [Micrococcales bacterium]